MKTQYIIVFLALLSCQKSEQKTFRLQGHFVPSNFVEIKAEVSGTLAGIHFQDGQKVKENDLLFTIDSRAYEAALDLAVSTRMQNLSKLQYAAEKVDRFKTLLANKYVSETDCAPYISELTNYESAMMQNDADIKIAKINLEKCSIKAPFSGVIGRHFIDKGNLILTDKPTLVTLSQTDPIYIDVQVSEKEYVKIRSLTKLHLTLNHQKDKIDAELVFIDTRVNPLNGTILLRAKVPNSEGKFIAGQTAKLIIQ